MKKILFAVLFCAFAATSTAAEKPGVIWCSTPVRPGEAVMIYGGNWGKNPVVKLANGTTIKPFKVTGEMLLFEYPANMPFKILKGLIAADGRESRGFELNSPDVWWIQGDWGSEASPGGWLRIFGRCISFDNKAVVKLDGSGGSIELKPEKQECWSANVIIPKNITAGKYKVSVSNGLGGFYPAGNVKIAPHKEVWKTKVFDVTKFGAVANDGFSDTQAVQSALEAIKKNNGGILYFPRGRFLLSGTLEIPPHTLLKGKSRELSQIYWRDTMTPPETLIKGTHSFGVEAITITSGFHKDGISASGNNITIRDIRMRLIHTQYLTPGESTRRESISGHGSGLRLSGTFIRVMDSDIMCVAGGGIRISAEYALVENNSFTKASRVGHCGFAGNQMIFNNNRITGIGASFGPGKAQGSQNIYWGNNVQDINLSWDRESMTTDGGIPSYKGTASAVNGRELHFKKIGWRFGPDFWKDGYVQLIAGKGAGQIRKIAKIEKNKVTVDSPWEVQPDEKTYIVIAAFRRRFIYVNNEVNDSTVGMQLYGTMIEAVIANNKTSRTGGFHNYGMTKGHYPEVNWFVQYFDNQVMEGNAYRGPMNEIPARDSHIAIRDRGVPRSIGKFPITRACLMRRNTLHSNAHFEVLGDADGVLLENGLVKNADNGIHVQARSNNVVLRGNRFDNVKKPYICADNTMLSKRERLAGAISGAGTILGDKAPPEWKALLGKIKTAKAPEEVYAKAVKVLAGQQKNKPVSGKVIEALLGIKIEAPNWRSVSGIFSGRGGKANLLITSPKANLPCRIKFKPARIPGWKITGSVMECDPGTSGRAFLAITKPAGRITAFMLPMLCMAKGKDWTLVFDTEISNTAYPYALTDFLVAGPFKNKSGKKIDTTVHPPELKLNVSSKYTTLDGRKGWKQVKANRGRIELNKLFKHSNMAVAYAVAVLRAKKPIQIRLNFINKTTLCFVNGKQVGTPLQRGHWGCVALKKGDNVLMLVSTNLSDPRWQIGVRFSIAGKFLPGDLTVIPANELSKLDVLNAGGRKSSEPVKLPNGMGLKWELVIDDNFNRKRLGSYITGHFNVPSYHKAGLIIKDGSICCYGGNGVYTINEKFKLPVRVEFDFRLDKSRKLFGLLLGKTGGTKLMLNKKLRYGYYFSPVGIGNNSFSRNAKVIFTGKQSIIQEVKAKKWNHATFQIVSPHCQFYFNGKMKFDFDDKDFLKGLDEIALWSQPGVAIDNLKIYTVSP